MAWRGLDVNTEGRRRPAKRSSANAGRVHSLEELLFERSHTRIGGRHAERAHERMLCKTCDLVERRPYPNADDKGWTGIRRLLAHACQNRIDDSLPSGAGREHDDSARVIRTASFAHDVQSRP